MDFRNVLIAVDSEPVAAHAADVGLALARSLGADLALIHVIESATAYGADTGIPPAELIASAEQEGRRLLAGFRQRLALPPSTLEFVIAGNPADEIVKAAKEWPADLLVIGSHGRGSIQRALLGSVAEGVMRHAPCPLVTVRAKA